MMKTCFLTSKYVRACPPFFLPQAPSQQYHLHEDFDLSANRLCLSEHGGNIAFMNNRGGVGGCAGEWSICGGNSQSFSDATVIGCINDVFSPWADLAVVYSGRIACRVKFFKRVSLPI